MPLQWLRLPGVPRQHPTARSHRAHGKGAGCRTARRAAQPCPAGATTGAGITRHKRRKSETDPGCILCSCSRGKSAWSEGISTGNVWISQIHSQDSPRLLRTRCLRAGRSLVRGGPREPSLISLLENNPWEMSAKGFQTGFGASIHASCSWGEHPFHAKHPEG